MLLHRLETGPLYNGREEEEEEEEEERRRRRRRRRRINVKLMMKRIVQQGDRSRRSLAGTG